MGRRPTQGIAGKTVAVYLSDEQVGFIRRAAVAEDVTVSEIVRRAVNRYFFLSEKATPSSAGREVA